MRIPIHFFHDVLCAYCTLTSRRLRSLQHEFGEALEITLRPYPLRPHPAQPSARELRRLARHARSVARAPEGKGFGPELWRGGDPPLSSTPALVALEAALLQGAEARDRLLERLRTLAFGGGVNVARRDVILEVAGAVGLDMGRFVVAFDSPAATRAVEISHRDAVAHGVRALPAVVIGEQWLLTGVRELDEYRDALLSWTERFSLQPPRLVH